MSQLFSPFLIVLLAILLANASFLTNKLFFVFRLMQPKKITSHLFELLIFYILLGCIAYFLEGNSANISSKTWEFYAITVLMFLTLSFPGFVYRYLLKLAD